MRLNRRPPEDSHVTSAGNGDRCGILGDYPVYMSPARCPPLFHLPPSPPPPPPFSPSPSPVFPFQRLEDRVFDFRLRSMCPTTSFVETSSRRNNISALDWRSSQLYRATEPRYSPDYPRTDNEKRLPDERERDVSHFAYNAISNLPRSMRQNVSTPPPPSHSSVSSSYFPPASVTAHFVEASRRQAIGGELQVPVIRASVENYEEKRHQQITCSRKTDIKNTFPAEHWFRSRDTTDEVHTGNYYFDDCGGEFDVSSRRSRRVSKIKIVASGIFCEYEKHSPASCRCVYSPQVLQLDRRSLKTPVCKYGVECVSNGASWTDMF